MVYSLSWLKPLASAVAGTAIGRRYTHYVLETHLAQCIERVARYFAETASFDNAIFHSNQINGFEDVAWLFSLSPTNKGIILMDIDEAAYLFRLVKSLESPRCVEIGRFRGGATFLIAAAMGGKGHLVSIDNRTKLDLSVHGALYDRSLQDALDRFQLGKTVDLVVCDSCAVPFEPESFDLVFIDGDHTYEGASRDFHYWKGAVKPGGHILLHDAVKRRPFSSFEEGVSRLVKEIGADPNYVEEAAPGSIVHYARAKTVSVKG